MRLREVIATAAAVLKGAVQVAGNGLVESAKAVLNEVKEIGTGVVGSVLGAINAIFGGNEESGGDTNRIYFTVALSHRLHSGMETHTETYYLNHRTSPQQSSYPPVV